VENSELREELRRRGRERLAPFSPETVAATLRDALESL
jgi:hypothetical protein